MTNQDREGAENKTVKNFNEIEIPTWQKIAITAAVIVGIIAISFGLYYFLVPAATGLALGRNSNNLDDTGTNSETKEPHKPEPKYDYCANGNMGFPNSEDYNGLYTGDVNFDEFVKVQSQIKISSTHCSGESSESGVDT